MPKIKIGKIEFEFDSFTETGARFEIDSYLKSEVKKRALTYHCPAAIKVDDLKPQIIPIKSQIFFIPKQFEQPGFVSKKLSNAEKRELRRNSAVLNREFFQKAGLSRKELQTRMAALSPKNELKWPKKEIEALVPKISFRLYLNTKFLIAMGVAKGNGFRARYEMKVPKNVWWSFKPFKSCDESDYSIYERDYARSLKWSDEQRKLSVGARDFYDATLEHMKESDVLKKLKKKYKAAEVEKDS